MGQGVTGPRTGVRVRIQPWQALVNPQLNGCIYSEKPQTYWRKMYRKFLFYRHWKLPHQHLFGQKTHDNSWKGDLWNILVWTACLCYWEKQLLTLLGYVSCAKHVGGRTPISLSPRLCELETLSSSCFKGRETKAQGFKTSPMVWF